MRLSVVQNGHTFGVKAIMLLYRVMTGFSAPGVMRTLAYRPQFFGDHYNVWLNHVMRGSSHWSVGERELFAAFTSKVNHCEF
jgi:hypothetical protein